MFKTLVLSAALLLSSLTPLSAQFKETAVPDYYLQYVPCVAGVTLGLLGVGGSHIAEDGQHRTVDRLIVTGVGIIAETVIVNSLKYTVREERPDGSAHNSFPSGHTATAFLGAEIVRHEYGWGWGAAAYSVAASVAALRVYHDRHYWWDTVAGAGCGVLSAQIGYWTLKPVKRLFGLSLPDESSMSMVPVADAFTGTYGLALALRF